MIRDNLWAFINTASINATCLQRYTDKMRKRYRNWYRVVPLVLLGGITAGVVAEILKMDYSGLITIFASALAAIISTLKDYSPQMIGLQSLDEIREADKLNIYYSKLMCKLEILLFKLDSKLIDVENVADVLLEYKDRESEKGVALNKLVRTIKKKENEEINKQSKLYIKNTFGLKNEE